MSHSKLPRRRRTPTWIGSYYEELGIGSGILDPEEAQE